MNPIHSLRGSLLLGALASAPLLHAAPTVEDSFLTGGTDYALSNLIGQGPATTGFTGTWLEAYGGAESPTVLDAADGLSYSSLSHTMGTAGGSVEYGAQGNGRTGRLLAAPYDDATKGDVYFSVLIQLDELNSVYRGVELHSGGFDDGANRKLQIVVGEGGNPNFVARLFNNNDDGFSADLGAADIDVNLFVGKISFSKNNNADSVKIWRNPSNLDGEYFSGPADFEKSGFNLQIDRVSFARFGGDVSTDATTLYDEVRFGPTWGDVTTIASPDSDADGLPDDWETQIILAAAAEDPPVILALTDIKGPLDGTSSDYDMDGSNDDDEFANMTDPTNPDTDDDDLNDGAEAAAGTDPCNPDSDDDTLTDGSEVDIHMTDPNVADTDGDLENDGFEIFQGTDPKVGGENSNSTALGLVQVNGTRDGLYGGAITVQTINTEFGDNGSELNAGYGLVQDGKLYILLTGNIENNFNKLEIFIDSEDEGQTSYASVTNPMTTEAVDGTDSLDDMFFDAGFTANYHLIARRGLGKFDLDYINLNAGTFGSYEDILTFGEEGYGSTGTGANTMPIRAAYDGSNTGGVTGGTGPADQVAAAAVTTGLELCINLADLGNPTGAIRVMAIINNSNHDFLSNQALGGLPDGTGNLGNPAFAEFDVIAGDQFFTIGLVESAEFTISDVQLINSGTQLQLTVSGLTDGNSYQLRESAALDGFGAPTSAVTPSASFVASGTSQVLVIDKPAADQRFYLIADAP